MEEERQLHTINKIIDDNYAHSEHSDTYDNDSPGKHTSQNCVSIVDSFIQMAEQIIIELLELSKFPNSYVEEVDAQ